MIIELGGWDGVEYRQQRQRGKVCSQAAFRAGGVNYQHYSVESNVVGADD